MQLKAPAIVLAARPHGENAVILRALTREAGMVAAYVAGGQGRRLRPVVIPGNSVEADIRARSASQLPFGKVELVTSRAPWLNEPLPAAAILWITALTASTLPERNPYPSLYDALGGLLDAICHAPSARGWAPALLSYEVLLLRELGYGGMKPEAGDLPQTLAALGALGPALERYLLAERHGDAMAARGRLLERLARIA
ncbi:DNA repair protein RecO [Citromicrobium sp. WPS32]|uniref:DNA repair protein RecO n=1 Tax=Citromicrobium sp. WPS32 TaxID=1634517 RepID=UPI0006C8E634|nr:recombination protein O N-terminal domain-containing protein [Citromicrobium sp. WPS32]KPM18255.1 DNA recombination protein RecO [Citromicrobium sp. WPS32]MAY76874.1 DNA recombination protein RecO [Citromicrobium sp.]|tara:strand:+ start:3971 stop:4567 length:597 start_codon:yes stop_codon:yes gene_type:complete